MSGDILRGTVVPARLPGKSIAVWRSASGTIYANGDRCPHRGMRLSHGFVRGQTLSCIYHGWRFGTDGACQKIPAHPAVVPPNTINCGPLPAAETNGVVWVAAAQLDDAPPTFPGYSALRSLVIAAPTPAITSATDGALEGTAIRTRLAGENAILLLSHYGPDEVFVIALVAETISGSARVSVSTAFEDLRRTAETLGAAV